jgi:oligopeptidase B
MFVSVSAPSRLSNPAAPPQTPIRFAGALLLGSALLRTPELFGSAVLRVPFLDPLSCMRDPQLPLTLHERDEWGDSGSDPHAFAVISTECPYHTLISSSSTGSRGDAGASKPLPLPPVLASCSLDDARVPVWAVAKWVAAARHAARAPAISSEPLLLRTRQHGGHSGSSAQQAEELAQDFAFILSMDRTSSFTASLSLSPSAK